MLSRYQMDKTVEHLMKGNYQEKEEVLEAIKEYRNQRLMNNEDERAEVVYFKNMMLNLNKLETSNL